MIAHGLQPALAQDEALVPFLDIPGSFTTSPSEGVRVLDIRRIDGPLTPRDEFYTLQHYGQPEIDPASYRLTIAGLVDRPWTAGGVGWTRCTSSRTEEVRGPYRPSGRADHRPSRG